MSSAEPPKGRTESPADLSRPGRKEERMGGRLNQTNTTIQLCLT